MKNRAVKILLVTAFLMKGCSAIPFAPQEDDTKAKSFQVESGKSNIYLYQTESDESASVRVTLNGNDAGKLWLNTYFMWSVSPGSHTIGSVIEDTTTLTINTKAGKNYFIWQDIETGSTFGGRTKISLKLKEVSDEAGRKGVKKSKRVESKN